MSEENVEVVRGIYAELERGNFWIGESLEPSVHVTWANPIFVRQAETRGIQELTGHMQEFLDAWEQVTATAERIIDVGDRVVTIEVWRARGKASGVDVEVRQGSVWTISNGKVSSIVNYGDPAEALEAAGLSE